MGYKVSKTKFRAALLGSLGIVTTIAKRMQVTRKTVYQLINTNPELKDELRDERDKILDRAESVLYQKVNEGDWKATEFLLTKLGRDRGYATKHIIDANVTTNITAESFAEAYEELKKDESEKSD